MKRGLKGISPLFRYSVRKRYNRFPDEKGTERLQLTTLAAKSDGYNRFPDEKGTESLFNPPIPPCQGGITTAIPMKRGLKARELWVGRYFSPTSYNRFPDEKGTESCNGRSDLRIATRYSKPFMVDFRIT